MPENAMVPGIKSKEIQNGAEFWPVTEQRK
jgi:hypothetical protein